MMCVVHLEDWRESAGTIDVVIFPRTWQTCQDFVEEGEIIRVKGKFDTSRGDPQVIADEVSQNFTVQRAENGDDPYAPPAYIMDETLDWSDDEDVDDEPIATNGNGYAPSEVAPPPMEDTAPTAETPPMVDEMPPPAPDLPPHLREINGDQAAETPARRWIYVFLQRSGDDERDQRRLKRVHNTLVNFPGDDHFSIVTESAGKSVELEFKMTTGVCEDLVKNLENIVGADNIEVYTEG